MNDPEASLRSRAKLLLAEHCETIEEAPVDLRYGTAGKVDVLARPHELGLHHLSLAFEMKVARCFSDGVAGKWLKQASDYVQARPSNGWPVVAAAFFWRVDMPNEIEWRAAERVLGILHAAAHFRVGSAILGERGGLDLFLGPHHILREGRGWNPRAAEWLLAKRQDAGLRRPI